MAIACDPLATTVDKGPPRCVFRGRPESPKDLQGLKHISAGPVSYTSMDFVKTFNVLCQAIIIFRCFKNRKKYRKTPELYSACFSFKCNDISCILKLSKI